MSCHGPFPSLECRLHMWSHTSYLRTMKSKANELFMSMEQKEIKSRVLGVVIAQDCLPLNCLSHEEINSYLMLILFTVECIPK